MSLSDLHVIFLSPGRSKRMDFQGQEDTMLRAIPIPLIGFCWLFIAGCSTHATCAAASKSLPGNISQFGSGRKSFPTVTFSLRREALAVLDGFNTALVHHNVSRARSFISSRYFRACNEYHSQGARYLRCLLDDTPLPVRYRNGTIERASPGSKELMALVTYYLLNGHYQPFYLNLLPGPHGLWIDSGGLPRG